MVRVAFSALFDTGIKKPSVFGASDCIVYAVPLLRFWMLPSVFVDVFFLRWYPSVVFLRSLFLENRRGYGSENIVQ